MLFDPAKQKLDLPASPVEGGDCDSRARHVVGEERERLSVVALDADAAQRDRQLGIALAGEGGLFVGKDGEPVAANHLEIARLHHP